MSVDGDVRTIEEPVGSLPFIDLAWLDDHHQAKRADRRAMVEALDLQAGECVIDVGCGPGYWSELFAEQVGATGRVVGVDLSPQLVGHARARNERGPFADRLDFRVGRFDDLPVADGAGSTVFFGNCLTYVGATDRVFAELRRITRPGGRIAVKDFDGGALVIHPLDRALTYRVLAAADRALVETPPDPPFDNYAGRKVNGLMRNAGLADVATRSWAIQFTAPLAPPAARYIRGNAEWYARTATPFLDAPDQAAWLAAFDPGSPDYILDRPDFYFCMLEILAVGRVGG